MSIACWVEWLNRLFRRVVSFCFVCRCGKKKNCPVTSDFQSVSLDPTSGRPVPNSSDPLNNVEVAAKADSGHVPGAAGTQQVCDGGRPNEAVNSGVQPRPTSLPRRPPENSAVGFESSVWRQHPAVESVRLTFAANQRTYCSALYLACTGVSTLSFHSLCMRADVVFLLVQVRGCR